MCVDYMSSNTDLTQLLYIEYSSTLCSVCIPVKVKVSLERAMKTQMGSRGIALLFL
jgi:hypothetical protein